MVFKDIKDSNGYIRYGDLTGQTYNDDISIYDKGLTSLQGFPKVVNGSVNLGDNKLTSLQYAPEKVTGSFDCSNNDLTSLEGCPTEIGTSLFCEGNTKMKNQLDQIYRFNINAERYSTDGYGIQSKAQVYKYFDGLKRKDLIKSKGFRTLLGYNK